MMQYEIEYENILRLDAIGSSNITFALVSLQPLSTQINSLDNNAKNKKEFERFFSEENIFDTDLNKMVICIDPGLKKWVDFNGAEV